MILRRPIQAGPTEKDGAGLNMRNRARVFVPGPSSIRVASFLVL